MRGPASALTARRATTATARSAATQCRDPAPRARARALSATRKSGARSASTWIRSARMRRSTRPIRSLAVHLKFRSSPRPLVRCACTTATSTTTLLIMISSSARAQTRASSPLPATAPTRRWSRARPRRSRRTAAAFRPSSRGTWTPSAKSSPSCRRQSPSPLRWTSTRRVCRFCRG